jgi:hypothetical protein
MVEHKIAYGLCGETVSDITGLKAKGIIDFDQVVRPGVEPDPNFVARCNAAGVSPNFNNGNDGVSGCGGKDCNTYYQRIAAAGYHSAGGESEPKEEWHAIMNNLIGRNYGGDWGSCPGGFSDIFSHQLSGENVIGHGMSSILETYTTSVQLCTAGVVSACVNAAKHGCKEVGIMIGDWMPKTAQPYIDMIQQIEAQGVKVGCVVVWAGYGSSMDAVYSRWQSVINQLQAIWPPEMTTLKARFGAVKPTGMGISADKMNIKINDKVVFTGKLMTDNKPLAGKKITIDGIAATTDANGQAIVSEQFTSSGNKAIYAKFAGDSDYMASTSNKIDITVQDAPVDEVGPVYAFVRGIDNALWYRKLDNSAWGPWASLGGNITASPWTEVGAKGNVYVFARGGDKAVWYRYVTPEGVWSAWTSLGGQVQV